MTTCGVCGAKTDAFVCNRCIASLERQLGDFPALLLELGVAVARRSRTYRAGGRHVVEDEPVDPEAHIPARLRSRDGRTALRAFALPYDDDAADVRDETWSTLGTWARHLAEMRGAEPPTDATLLGWLLTHVGAVAMDEAGPQIVDEIAWARRRVEWTIDNSPERVFCGPCGALVYDVETVMRDGTVYMLAVDRECALDLYREPAALHARCDGHRQGDGGCGAVHDLADRERQLRASVDDLLAPLEEWRAALPQMFPALSWPSRWTWQRLAGRLEPHGLDRHGRPMVRGGDVLDLVEESLAAALVTRRRRRAS